ncbi:low temperature requirement protein LtrA [Deinococcus sp. HSC-46F16]|uniref:low temperature requirement protein A n=1 Tax=Deinococcus sp. HSC-46F16 TaxID=2910968 RepID=UPI00209E8924|nr:low temperature requirement protein LtrA [Deinococcus sp. HSC-46F16]
MDRIPGSTNELGDETASGTWRRPDRPLFEPPRLRTGEQGERQTTWMELFFDLVFVVAVDQVARRLEGGITGSAVLGFLVLSVPVWWAWVGYVYYVDRFGTDDLSDRLITLVQMGLALMLALRAQDALGSGAAGFAFAYGAFRLVLALSYAYAARASPEAREAASRFALGYGLAALLWLVSALVPAPARFWLWGAAFVVDVGTPLVLARWNGRFPPNTGHLQERFGNFTLIVLGESTVGAVEGLRQQTQGPAAGIAALALLLAFALWWVYFETSDGAPVQAVREGRTAPYNTWLYAHLPFTVGIGAGAMGVMHAIREAAQPALSDPSRWLLAGAIALCFAALAVINWAYLASGSRWDGPQVGWNLLAAGLALGIAAFAGGLPALGVMGLLTASSLLPIGLDLWRRARRQGG